MTDLSHQEYVKAVTEAAIFANQKPITISRLLETVFGDSDVKRREVKKALVDIEEEYRLKGINLVEVADGYLFRTAPQFNNELACLWEESPPRYSRALLETLALIAYKQPITKPQIEEVRGVSVSFTITKTLLERNWIKAVGVLEVPGRPTLYGTTNEFLNYFGICSLDELPALDEIKTDSLSLGEFDGTPPANQEQTDEQLKIDLEAKPQ